MKQPAMNWDDPSLRWVPWVSRQSSRLEIPGFFRRYTGVILEEDLPSALRKLAGDDGLIDVDVTPADQDSDPASIAITAERLTERFDARELRRCVQDCFDAAALEGDLRAEQDFERVREYLDEFGDG